MNHTKPLNGIRVLEICAYIAGPYCGALLASLGADVVKVEPPRGGEPFRRGNTNRDPYFMQYNAGKRSISVDLKAPDGIALIKSLLPGFDVLIENNRPGKLAGLGLGIEVCRAINPSLVYTSVSGFGEGGPLCDRPAYDSIGQSIAGNYSLMNEPGSAKLAGGAIADLISGIIATTGVLASLVGRAQRGQAHGTLIQTSLMEAMSSITIDAVTSFYERGESPTRQSRHPQAQAYCMNTADGGAITLHLSVSERFWQSLTKAIEREDLTSDLRFANYNDRLNNYFELEVILLEEFSKRSQQAWEERLLSCDVPYAPVLTIEDVIDHPQTKWLKLMEQKHEGLGLVRPPWRFEGERPIRDLKVPLAGEHSREIAAEVLRETDVEELVRKGILCLSTSV